MKRSSLVVLMILLTLNVMATHNRAGEITYKQISGLTYEITITTFTYTLSAADRNELEVQWGDNTTSIAPRTDKVELPNFYYHNTYVAQHTFPGPGTYLIVVQDPNRNFGVLNIPNSVNVVFSVKTTLVINPVTGGNSTPVLLNFPIDKAAIGHVFIHNPGAFDYDGDSLAYSMTVCSEEGGKPIPGYTLPEASDTIYVNPISGDLVWDSPVDSGIYNVAMNIEEYRDGIKIGNIVRDMQIEVFNVKNDPPVNPPLKDFCVTAGDTLVFDVTATDPNDDEVKTSFTGGPFIMDDSPAVYNTLETKPGQTTTRFTWATNCSHVRKKPYNVLVKSEDQNAELSLVDIDEFKIKVLAPPTEILKTIPANNSVTLVWARSSCDNASGYEIFRSSKHYGYVPDSCTGGVPDFTGYTRIGETSGLNDTVLIDNDNGEGLQQGFDYCYMVVVVFPDGAESFPSQEVCTSLVPGIPALTQASVTAIDENNGSVLVSWIKPTGLDTIPAPGPYEYVIYRSDDLWGNNFIPIYSFASADLNDTTYINSGINTLKYPYIYKVALYNNTPGNRFLLGSQETASTLYPEPVAMDNAVQLNFVKNVPWVNQSYTVYRKNNNTGQFDSLAVSYEESYVDSGLKNGTEYCYRVKSLGKRENNGIMYYNENWSHEICVAPVDTFAPCPPDLTVVSSCDSLYNLLTWTNPNLSCANDVTGYKIYYTTRIKQDMKLLTEITPATQTYYYHFPENTMAGCYYITAVDSFLNESKPSMRWCIDNCTNYELPNFFSPNGDNINDEFRPGPYSFVQKVDMKIYNRYGTLVFETNDPDIKWKGRDRKSNSMVPPGVYYYLCDVYEERLTGLEVRNMVGFVHVFYEKGARPSE